MHDVTNTKKKPVDVVVVPLLVVPPLAAAVPLVIDVMAAAAARFDRRLWSRAPHEAPAADSTVWLSTSRIRG